MVVYLQVMLGVEVCIVRRRSGDRTHPAAVRCDFVGRSREEYSHEMPESESGGQAWNQTHIPATAEVSAQSRGRELTNAALAWLCAPQV